MGEEQLTELPQVRGQRRKMGRTEGVLREGVTIVLQAEEWRTLV
jgi:hypothetical protein